MIFEELIYVFIILTKKEAVEKYGSRRCKEHFKKYGRFKNKQTEQALIKTLEQHFEKVEVVKQGKSFVYQLENQRKETVERKDNRKFNGGLNKKYGNDDFYKDGCKVYIATDLTNGKTYVGSTKTKLADRINMHELASKNKNQLNYNSQIAKAIREHGIENFKWEIIEFWDDENTLEDAEDYWIIKTNSLTEGYNQKLNHVKGYKKLFLDKEGAKKNYVKTI